VDFSYAFHAAIGLLVIEGRVSYRRLQAEFDLNDTQLDALRFELTEVKGLAVDQGGQVLVWAGNGSAMIDHAHRPALAARPTLRLAEPAPHEDAAQTASPQRLAAPPPAEPVASDAERRPLTVMFCDLADSTALSRKLDPEDLQDVIRAYRERCTAIIREYEGFVAKYMGDGILVYFGYPKSLERNVERAIRTGLAIVEAMAALNAELGQAKGIDIAVRIGVATGLVVVGEIVGEGLAQERTVIGEAPNVAARLQSVAPRNGIVIGALTKEIAGDVFVYEDLGAHEVKGIAGLVKAFGVTGLRAQAAEDDAEDEAAEGAPTLVGRDEEIGLLRRAWQSTKDEGRGQIVLVSGEPGIGKSTLVNTLRALVRAEGLMRITYRCSAYHTNSALYPMIEHIRRIAGWQLEDDAATRLNKLEAMLEGYSLPRDEAVPVFAALLSLPVPADRYPPLDLTPQQPKQQTEDLLVAWTLEEAERQPVLAVWEDLHWADPSTLDFLGLLVEQVPTAPLLMVFTFRPEFILPWPPRSHVTSITLNSLERPQIEAMVEGLAGNRGLPDEVVEHIVSKTDGVPLYVEELAKTILRSGVLLRQGDKYVLSGPLSEVVIPASLQESLMARLDRLPTVREVAQLGAVLGREFAYEVLQAIGVLEESKLRDGLGQLVEAELLYQRGRPPRARYIFKHALIQDAAYQSLLKRTRQQYHRQVAELLESKFPEVVEAQPELLARHFTEAGRLSEAVAYWQRAGEKAVQRSADREAIGHLTRALELLATLPDTPERVVRELSLQTRLGPAVMATKGYASPEATAIYSRARELARAAGDSQDICPVLFGVWLFNLVRGDHVAAREVAEDLLELAERGGEPGPRMFGHHALGVSLVHMGAPDAARRHFEQILALYDVEAHHRLAFRYGLDVGAHAQAYLAWPLWLLGQPDQALHAQSRALALLGQINHSYTQSRTHYINAILHQFRREAALLRERAEQAMASAREHSFALVLAVATILEGAAMAGEGRHADGSEQIRTGLAAYRATGAAFQTTHHLILLAEALGAAGSPEEGLDALNEAAAQAEKSGERYCEAEIYRLRGELLLAQSRDNQAEAEGCFHQALDVAREQEAKSLELRAATSLARLWRDQARTDDARDLLAQVYDWFTEGFDTADPKDAKALLEALPAKVPC
jgi:class 3 adenylate cyclase/predicted ATPase